MSTSFKKGMGVVQVFSLAGLETAIVTEVESVRKGVVTVKDSEKRYNGDGREIDPSGMGSFRLIQLEAVG